MVCAPVRRDNPRALALARGLSTVQTMLYLTCTTITSVDHAHYLVLKIGYLWWYKCIYFTLLVCILISIKIKPIINILMTCAKWKI